MSPTRTPYWWGIPATLLCLSVTAALLIQPHWTTAVMSLLILGVGAGRSLRRGEPWTLADHVTTTRLGLILVFCATTLSDIGFSWSTVLIGAVALSLDGVDGVIARQTGSTEAGAIYDESVDALFVLILGIVVLPVWGPWTVLPGLMFYLFHAVAFFRRTWQRPLPASTLRKTIAAAQGILLLTAGSPLALTYTWIGIGCVGLALVSLAVSFARDLFWLEQQKHGT